MGKQHRKFYFSLRELRFSLVLIVLCSLLTVLLFTFAVKLVGEFFENLGYEIRGNIPVLIVVIIGYALIVFGITYFFSHRFIGPFERLKTDIGIIRGGYYHRRLETRDRDDIYIRYFVKEVNMMLDEFESLCRSREELKNIIEIDLKSIIEAFENKDMSHNAVRELLIPLRKKLVALHEKSCTPCNSVR